MRLIDLSVQQRRVTLATADRPWLDTSRSPQEQATALVAAMSTEQKIAQLHHQDQLISAVAATSPRTAVVLKDSNPVVMPWIEQVPAVLEAFNQGTEDGHAVADLLLGVVNPAANCPAPMPAPPTTSPWLVGPSAPRDR